MKFAAIFALMQSTNTIRVGQKAMLAKQMKFM